MRDVQIINELGNLKKRNAIVYKQMVFVNTRMQAFENILSVSGLWTRLLLIIWPSAFMAAVDRAQLVLMAEHDEALRAAEVAPPPQKLTVIQNGAVKEMQVNGDR